MLTPRPVPVRIGTPAKYAAATAALPLFFLYLCGVFLPPLPLEIFSAKGALILLILLAAQIPMWLLWWKQLDRVQLSGDAIVCERHGRLAYADIVTISTDGPALELRLRGGRVLRIRPRANSRWGQDIDDYSFKLFRQRFADAYAAWRLEQDKTDGARGIAP